MFRTDLYIDGKWRAAFRIGERFDVINPADETNWLPSPRRRKLTVGRGRRRARRYEDLGGKATPRMRELRSFAAGSIL